MTFWNIAHAIIIFEVIAIMTHIIIEIVKDYKND